MGFGRRIDKGMTAFQLRVSALVQLARDQGGGYGWIDVLFNDPDWDFEGLAPKETYVLYHTVYELLLGSSAEVEHHRWFCVRKARNLQPG